MELLISIRDKPSTSKRQAAELIGRGDVITIQSNGWSWSKKERENPDWVIVQTDLLPSEVKALLCVENNVGQYKPYYFTRQNKLDLNKFKIKPGKEIQKVEKVDICNCMIHKGTACAQ